MNKAILIGNLTRDPDLRKTQNDTPVCNFTVAVQRRFTNTQGEREADFINCIAWRNTAEFIKRNFTKGSRIGVVGSIQNRTYTGQDGSKRYATEIIVDEADFAGSKPAANAPHDPDPAPEAEPAGNFGGFEAVSADNDEPPF